MKNKKGFTLIEMFIVLSIIGIVVAVLIPIACDDKKGRTYRNNIQYTERVGHNEDSTEEYTIITIDGCEYIKTGNILTHKANCKNPVHGIK